MEERKNKFESSLFEIKDKVLKDYEKYKTEDWVEVKTTDVKKQHIQLYETTVKGDGVYLLKAEAISEKCTAEQLLALNIDNNYETRQQWETGELMDIREVLTFDKIKLIQYWINIPVPLVSNREFFGLQWYAYDEKLKTYILIFRSIENDKLLPCDTSKYVRGDCTSIMEITELDIAKIAVTIYTYVRPLGWIPDWILPAWKEKLRDRIMLYEKICSEKFDLVYSDGFKIDI